MFILVVKIVNVDGSVICDKIKGIPYLSDNGEIDIVFDSGGEMILLKHRQKDLKMVK